MAKEAYLQAEKRLTDVLDLKKTIEQKATAFFGAYLSASLALIGIGGAIFKDHGIGGKSLPFFLTGLIFIAGAVVFMLALKDRRYGFLGSPPDMWLNKGVIDGEDTALDAMYAYLAFYHADRISVSIASNRRKMALIRQGM